MREIGIGRPREMSILVSATHDGDDRLLCLHGALILRIGKAAEYAASLFLVASLLLSSHRMNELCVRGRVLICFVRSNNGHEPI
jgi:hypothetical protein